MVRISQLFEAWEKIFVAKQFDLSQDIHHISADEIKELTGIEARHMAKLDSRAVFPTAISRHGYFILPIKRGGYILVRGEGFHELEELPSEQNFISQMEFDLTTMHRNTGESQYLDYCFNSGLLEEIVGHGRLYSCIRGRESSGVFEFNVGDNIVSVNAAQIETDMGLEGRDCIVILEAKSKIPKDFIIRQLYYPYRRFETLDTHKEVIPIFFSFDTKSQTYNFWIYKFADPLDYNSIQLVRTARYKIDPKTLNDQNTIPIGDVSEDVVPQANDLDKVLQLILLVKQGIRSLPEISEHFGFDVRQGRYYRDAAAALGFVQTHEGGDYQLTDKGEYLVGLEGHERDLDFIQTINNLGIVKRCMAILEANGKLDKDDIAIQITKSTTVTGTTIPRRVSTLHSWFKWIAEHTSAFEPRGAGFVKSQD